MLVSPNRVQITVSTLKTICPCSKHIPHQLQKHLSSLWPHPLCYIPPEADIVRGSDLLAIRCLAQRSLDDFQSDMQIVSSLSKLLTKFLLSVIWESIIHEKRSRGLTICKLLVNLHTGVGRMCVWWFVLICTTPECVMKYKSDDICNQLKKARREKNDDFTVEMHEFRCFTDYETPTSALCVHVPR